MGRAGSGKTRTCVEGIRRALRESPDGPPVFFLVPEQATFQMERDLLVAPDLQGMVRGQVVSFTRLAWRVFLQAGGAARRPLGELGKRMALRALVEDLGDQLRIFGRAAGTAGFIDKLAGSLRELKAYDISAETLTRRRDAMVRDGSGETLLALKLHDLALVARRFWEYLEGRFTDPDDTLDLLAEKLPASQLARGAAVWVDGFAGFTPQEYKVLASILREAEAIHVALCLDPAEIPRDPDPDKVAEVLQKLGDIYPFYPTLDTYRRLLLLAREADCPLSGSLILAGSEDQPRFRGVPVLAHLERELFNYPGRTFVARVVPAQENWNGIHLVAAANRRAEVEAAARQILCLARRGLRWRDMAVILRSLDSYAGLIAPVFKEHGIPCFVDRRRPASHHPLVELLGSAVEVYAYGWNYDALFRFLKTDLTPLSRDEVDLLENYVLAHGIEGARWTDGKPWRYLSRYSLEAEEHPGPEEEKFLQEVNRLRDRGVTVLRSFCQDLDFLRKTQGLSYRGVVEALFNLLDGLGVPDVLEKWRMEAEVAGDLDAAGEHHEIWNAVVDLLDQMVESLGERQTTPEEFAAVLDAGLQGLSLGLVPPGLDQVLVGSVKRSRHPDLKAAFVLGAVDGMLPAVIPEDAIFDDQEREVLARQGLELAPGGRQQSSQEEFLTYIALTRASAFLWVSYPMADDEGRALAPSAVISRIKELFSEIREHRFGLDPELLTTVDASPAGWDTDGSQTGSQVAEVCTEDEDLLCHHRAELDFITGERSAAARLARALSRARETGFLYPPWGTVYRYLVADGDRRERVRPILAGLTHQGLTEPLPRPLVEALFAKVHSTPEGIRKSLQMSVSRLESFAACPFKHFAAHGLKLERRPVQEVKAAEKGILMHAALSQFVTRLQEEGLQWGDLDSIRAGELIEEIVDRLVLGLQSQALLGSARKRFLVEMIKGILKRAVGVLGEHARRGCFSPLGVEVGFGTGEEGSLPPLEIRLGESTPGDSGGPMGDPAEGWWLELRGRIDRVDLARTDSGECFLRVIDYKSSPHNLQLDEIYYGLSLQLPAYLLVALQNFCRLEGRGQDSGIGQVIGQAGATGAGLFYFAVYNPMILADAPPEDRRLEKMLMKEMAMKGMVLAEPGVIRLMTGGEESPALITAVLKKDGTPATARGGMDRGQLELLLRYTRHQMKNLGHRIVSGQVAVRPIRYKAETACRYCDFKPVCGFEAGVGGGRYNSLRPLKPVEVWPLMSGVLEEGAGTGETGGELRDA